MSAFFLVKNAKVKKENTWSLTDLRQDGTVYSGPHCNETRSAGAACPQDTETMELRSSGLAVTSFLEVMQHFLWCISPQTYRHWVWMGSSAIGHSPTTTTHTVYLDRSVFVLRLSTHPLSGQSHCTTGSWWHPGRQTFLWQSLTRCTNGRRRIS